MQLLLGLESLDPNAVDFSGHTPLAWAAIKGRTRVVRQMLAGSIVEPEYRSARYRRTPLSYAAGNGREEVVELLLDTNRAFVDSEDVFARTPLSYAAEGGHTAIVDALLASGVGADSEFPTGKGRQALLCAAGRGHAEIVKRLLDSKQACLMSRDLTGRTALCYAAAGGYDSVVELLIALMTPSDLAIDNDTKARTPLSHAAENGHLSIVELLAQHYSLLDRDHEARTPIAYATNSGEEHVVRYLLKQGADPKSWDKFHRAPISHACEHGNEEVVKLLLHNHAASADKGNDEWRTPLSYAAARGHIGIVKLLLKSRATADSMDSFGRTPLWWACSGGWLSVAEHVLSRGDVSADGPNDNFRTPLTYAIMTRNMEIVKLLVSSGRVNPNRRIGNIPPPLCWAAGNCGREMVKFLVEQAGAHVNSCDEKGRTALFYADQRGKRPTVDYLLSRNAVYHQPSKI